VIVRLLIPKRRSSADGSIDSYRVHLRDGDGKVKGPCLSFWCMVPGVCLRELEATGVRSIVLTSGTLSPMESFAHELASACLRCAVARAHATDHAPCPACSNSASQSG
jgi:Rad3-related DNA helicase